MAMAGDAPRIFTKCTKSGIPYMATIASAVFVLLAFLNLSSTGSTVFNWFVNLINTGGYISWICVCIIYIRFRKATFAQKITDLPYRSRFQPVMAYVSGTSFLILMLLSGFEVFVDGYWNSSSFVTAYVGIPIFFLFYFGHKLTAGRHHKWVRRVEEVDMVSGLEDVILREKPVIKQKGFANKLKAAWE